MNVNEKYFSNITKRERAIFEGGISMGALFHQFVGTPVNNDTRENLEKTIEETFELQPAIEDVEVKINLNDNTEFDYISLSGDMLDVRIHTNVDGVKAVIRIEFIEELNYPLMYVEDLK